MDCLGFVVWEIGEHFGGVYQSHYCASDGAFLFFFCICNVSKYYFLFVWKANKVEVRENDVFMNDFHLCTLELAWSSLVSMSTVPGPLSSIIFMYIKCSFRSFDKYILSI